jgi:hypothetical protein
MSKVEREDGTIVVKHLPEGGGVEMTTSAPGSPVLLFTPAEWDAFVHGVNNKEFDLSGDAPGE